MNTSRERLARRAAEMLRDGMAGSIPEAIGQAMRRARGEAVRRPASNRCVVMWMPWKWPAWDWRPGLVIEERGSRRSISFLRRSSSTSMGWR